MHVETGLEALLRVVRTLSFSESTECSPTEIVNRGDHSMAFRCPVHRMQSFRDSSLRIVRPQS